MKFKVGDKVKIHNHLEPQFTVGHGTIIGVSRMGDEYYDVVGKPFPRRKTFYPMAGRNPGMYCNSPCIQVTCEAGEDLSLIGELKWN